MLSLDSFMPWQDAEQLAHEKEALGFYISSHPLTAVQPQLQRLVTANSQTLAEQPGGEVKVGGVITQQRTQLTKKGDRMAFLTLEDLYGTIEVIVFPETYRQSITCCESEEPLLIWGTVEGDSDGRIIAQRIMPLQSEEMWCQCRQLTLTLSPQVDKTVLLQVRELLSSAPGEAEVVLALAFEDGERVRLRASQRLCVAPTHQLLDDLDQLLGAGNVRVA
jgi:DNA polymerase-3 subunit alpha